jgi:hypothetical protein
MAFFLIFVTMENPYSSAHTPQAEPKCTSLLLLACTPYHFETDFFGKKRPDANVTLGPFELNDPVILADWIVFMCKALYSAHRDRG